MTPTSALIKSPQKGDVTKKVCGIYPLERNIRLLWQSGINDFHLDLNNDEKNLYIKKIEKKVKKLKNISIKLTDSKPVNTYYNIQSNHFIQFHYCNEIEKYFDIKDKVVTPKNLDDLFLVNTKADRKKAEKISTTHIRNNTGGFIARYINKSISIPLSRLFIRLGIHPNILTVANMFFAFGAAGAVLYQTYWMTLLGGILFQWVSIFDGCDGEVAKLTNKFSKFGSWFDTTNDYMAIIIFLAASAYRYLLKHDFAFTAIAYAVFPMFAALAILMLGIFIYLKKYSESGSFAAYEKEFLQHLPRKDIFVTAAWYLKYMGKKECYSLIILFLAIFNRIDLVIVIATAVHVVGAILVTIINIKYFKKLPFEKDQEGLMYVAKR